jgi:hypothetical protein
MNKNFNDWYLEAGITLRDDQVKSRWAGLEKFYKSVTVDNIINLVKLFYNMPVDQNFKDTFAEAFIEFDSAFSRKNERELSILAGSILVHIAETNGNLDSFVELLVRAAAFGKRKAVLKGIYLAIEQVFFNDMMKIREMDTNDENFPQIQSSSFAKSLETSGNGWTPDVAKVAIKYAKDIQEGFVKLTDAFCEMRYANEVFFEDSQLLWWLTAGWSKDLNCAYTSTNIQNVCLIIGKEAAELVKKFPGPYSIRGVLNRTVEDCKKASTIELDFAEVISVVDNAWKIRYNKSYNIQKVLDLLPISAALSRSENTQSKNEWIPKYNREVCNVANELKYSPIEYAMQIYYEVLAQKCYCEISKG